MKLLTLLVVATAATAMPHGPNDPSDHHGRRDAHSPSDPPDHHGRRSQALPGLSRRHGPDEDDHAATAPKPLPVAKPDAKPASPAQKPAQAISNPNAPKDGLQVGAGPAKTKTPAGCRKIASDVDWPAAAEWKKTFPDIVARSASLKPGVYRPDYSLRAENWKDVQTAVKFAAKNNIRISVINSGHDFLGRNDAPTGLTLDVSLLKGIKVLESFTPTAKGAEKPGKEPNVITPIPGKQAAVTIGASVTAQELHNQLSKSKLTSIGAAHGSVAPAGGFGQTAGHGPLSGLYGLGADQFLEFKVVTADGDLKVANKVSHPDLFWALRGGGGGTFGVVVEATVKAHPDVPITTSIWQLNTTKANGDGIWQAYAHLHTRFVDLVEKNGASGYYYIYPNFIKATFLHHGEFAGADKARKIWEPLLLKMSEFPDMVKATPKIEEYSNYKSYFDARFGAIDGGPAKKGPDPWEAEQQHKAKRHGPGSDMEMGSAPVPQAMANLDSRLLGAEHLANPNLTDYLRRAAPFALGPAQSVIQGHLVSGGKAHKPDDDTSVNPAWRKAYIHTIGYNVPGKVSVNSLRELAPTSGAYANEAFPLEENWKQSFWGTNYEKLSKLKTKYDPHMVFWVTPGINADLMEVRENRVCRVTTHAVKSVKHAPLTDNLNTGRQLGVYN